MIKVTGLNRLAKDIELTDAIAAQINKARKDEIKARAKELEAQGIDKEMAKTMAKVFYEYGL